MIFSSSNNNNNSNIHKTNVLNVYEKRKIVFNICLFRFKITGEKEAHERKTPYQIKTVYFHDEGDGYQAHHQTHHHH